MSRQSRIALILTILYVIFLLYSTSLPYDFTNDHKIISQNISSIRNIPFIRLDGTRESFPDMVTNFLAFVPLGLFSGYAAFMRRKKWSPGMILLLVFLGCGAFGALVETIQIFSISRVTSVTDVIINSIGGLFGAILALLFSSKLKAPLQRWSHRSALRSPELLLLIIYTTLLIMSSLAPLDFSLDVGSIKQGLKTARIDPLSDPAPMVKMLGQVLWFAGLSFLLCHTVSRHIGSRKLLAAILSMTVSFFLVALLEISQVFISSHIASTRDVLAGGVGTVYGGALFVALTSSVHRKPKRSADSTERPLPGRVMLWLFSAHYLIFVVHVALFPYRFGQPISMSASIREALVPFASYYGKTNVMALFDFLGGLARFAPLGFLLQGRRHLSQKLRIWWATLICFIFGFILEGLQLRITGRVADISDVIAAAGGGYLGFVAWRWWQKRAGKGNVPKGIGG